MPHWDSLWTNLHVATMVDGYGVVRDAAVAVQDGQLAWIGQHSDLPAHCRATTQYEGGGAWLLPGLIDCHTHLVYAGNRSDEFEARLNGVSYADIARQGGGILATVRATRAASEEQLLAASLPRLHAMLEQGMTTLEIKSGYGLDVATEARILRVARRIGRDFPVRVKTSFLGAHALPPEYLGRADAYIDLVCDVMLPALVADGLLDAVDAFCEHIGFTPGQTERVFQAAQAHGLPVKLHAEQLSDQGGAALTARYRGLSADHLEYLSPAGIAAMAEYGTVAVLLPGAYYFLRETQLPPLQGLRAAGVPIALATDCNPGTAPLTSLLLSMNMACTLFRMTPLEALQGVTCHAARALGLAAECGSLVVGRAADFGLWQIERPADLAYRIAGPGPLCTVFAGNIVAGKAQPVSNDV
ncbi:MULTISPECIES: imidazolonepropionase [unclassified Undibacterium]|uniref:imidazolonepropionase n=1 Tax=unclassified Undibacterium TaxID=2630295 RepID=UPI002AC944F6|nr:MULTISPECIES: imidazolonepropionase [unclassified Undibacterium]MEB0139643.1 imidazolonepropionase [Undibacterium sp. CCC2.1]MEB0171999.1 imidazolonepropionase [Undibacterium sp. CCC1.1]MEB0176312.1 imidazolonepropionase [Undibacterium sp. CCC3.4]MEB0213994.1 imidazolonepropionase [Undibacterium sp. 5I2]WPX43610.1 imidazolonepropionase [Undibacterium sp. CCC3.4]